jgi:macrolide-specific efflux system membrane fusion protein
MISALAALAATTFSVAAAPSGEIQLDSVLIKAVEQVEVPAREAGVLSAVHAREGQTLAKGDVMATVADRQAQLAEARAAIELSIATRQADNDIKVRFARKALEVSRAELKRAAESIKKYPKSISKSELDRLELTVQKAELEVEQAVHDHAIAALSKQLEKNKLSAAQEDVARRQIRAPMPGTVVQVYHREGEWVTPGKTVMRLVRTDRLRAEGFVDARQLRRPIQGAKVTLTVNLPGKPGATFPGELVFVSPEIEPVNSQIRVWAEVENDDLVLRPGLIGRMTIHLSEGE